MATILLDQKELPAGLIDRYSLAQRNPDVSEMWVPKEYYDVNDYVQRGWDDDLQWLLTQSVFGFSNPAKADAEYQAAPYGRTFSTGDGVEATVIPAEEAGLGADRAVVFCVADEKPALPVERCPKWGFRGKYGSYVVDVAFRASKDLGHAELEIGGFMDLVRAVDRHAQEKLRD
ncbi:hypothetical protein ABGB17_14485 [Sphaerisporangium sp. B11E5]|uniref:hypothetical protein n=1 Tax=Sphaerisporangium sp. B11E5 TaxID=3153563 RepID=UPI00325C5B6A